MITTGVLLDDTLARGVWCLQVDAYGAEAALIGDDRIPALHEMLADLRAAGLRWAFAHDEHGALVGGVACSLSTDGAVDVERLVVSPAHARRGVGGDLVAGVLTAAAHAGLDVVVSTASANTPALALYDRLGFGVTGRREVEPALEVTDLRWRHRAAVRVLCVTPKDAVLLLCWRDPVDSHLVWEPPGGGVEPGESSLDAARRELRGDRVVGAPRRRQLGRCRARRALGRASGHRRGAVLRRPGRWVPTALGGRTPAQGGRGAGRPCLGRCRRAPTPRRHPGATWTGRAGQRTLQPAVRTAPGPARSGPTVASQGAQTRRPTEGCAAPSSIRPVSGRADRASTRTSSRSVRRRRHRCR